MLNKDAADKARDRLKVAADSYDAHQSEVTQLAGDLYELRRSSSEALIGPIETFVRAIGGTPKEFDRAFAEYHVQLQTFDGVVADVDVRLHDIKVRGTAGAGAGVAAGAATAFAAPTAAMAIATTFGTASTGTAIATLSGAAANSAALAWLGGGALAAGGGGVSAGTALLALAGPVGLGLAGLAALGGAAYVAHANNKVVEEANQKLKPIEAGICALKVAIREILGLRDLTREHVAGMRELFNQLRDAAPQNYQDFEPEHRKMLAALINHVRSLSALLNKTLQEDIKGAQ